MSLEPIRHPLGWKLVSLLNAAGWTVTIESDPEVDDGVVVTARKFGQAPVVKKGASLGHVATELVEDCTRAQRRAAAPTAGEQLSLTG